MNKPVLLRGIKLVLALDLAERVIVGTFLAFFALRFVDAYLDSGIPVYLLLLVVEALPVGFILARRSTSDLSLNPADWCVAVAGTTLPLLVVAGGTPLVTSAFSSVIILIGVIVNCWAKLSLRRSFGVVAANRGVKTNGPYQYVRHPMYLGYFISQFGFLLFNPTFWNVLIYASAIVFQIFRIKAEERTLSKDATYRLYASKVPYRLIPGVF